MRRALPLLAALLLPLAAWADTLGLHTATWHDRPGYRAATPGLYWRLDNGATLGALSNSEGHFSAYAAWTWHTDEQRPLSAAVSAGLITGYSLAPVVPLIAPSVAVRLGEQATARLIVLPKWHAKQGATAAQLDFEWRL